MATRATPELEAGGAEPLEQLLVRSGGGDIEAFAELYDRLASRVFGLVTWLVRDEAASQRITCEAFIEAWHRAPTYDPAQLGATAWTLVIARRIAVSALRLSWPPVGHPAPATSVGRSFLLAAGLNRVQANALQLAWFGGLDHRRIEEELDSDEPATTLINEALGMLVAIGPRR
ncbi:hypothetical protein L2K70_17335 [Nocardioides KLBMP 9356]|uniref:RNA polymerase sigma-70 region 2 domain-containing protein n=1 Tax=Nocardioides potassii TaxID=2911371 RepID=A0ABS9HG86_9ACTN|nr:sigma factor [Nocardioides potassii]MCF6379377.1 hypothetical protein [Nocardioides potassii]